LCNFATMKTLSDYLKDTGMTQSEFAAKIGADVSVVSRFSRAHARPGLDLAVKIEQVTGGAVPVEAWLKEQAPQ
jgi:ribosome-binding protein aMBF1 (putative translation factor)